MKYFHYSNYDLLRTHLNDFMFANHFELRLTLYEYICRIWASEPETFILNSPIK
ncbi:transposase (plasmid) [Gluconobacter oxydans H24]|nr:transposase [Gluconobacter oxydans H24]